MYKHTLTTLQVLGDEQVKRSAKIEIGMQIVYPTETGPHNADERYAQFKATCEEEALAIYSLLQEHLPEETITKLTSLFRNL